MQFEVIESVTDAAHPINEDVWGYTASAAWVIDGASSVGEASLFSSGSDARWLGDMAGRQFELLLKGYTTNPRLKQAVESAALSVQAAIRSNATVEDYIPPSAAVTLVEITGNNELHYFGLGDVTLVVANNHRSFVLENRHSLKTELDWLAREDRSKTVAKPAIADPRIAKELRERRRTIMNRPGGYWILSDSPEAANHGVSGYLSIYKEDYVLLASDGFARLVTTFGEYANWTQLIQAAAHDTSLKAMLKRLRTLEDGDLERKKFPRMSAKDDATAVLVRVISG